jgi:hypothetical protein
MAPRNARLNHLDSQFLGPSGGSPPSMLFPRPPALAQPAEAAVSRQIVYLRAWGRVTSDRRRGLRRGSWPIRLTLRSYRFFEVSRETMAVDRAWLLLRIP